MPKLSGGNTKAQEANQRKHMLQKEKAETVKKLAEDAKWVDSDKHANAKLNRRAEMQQKQEQKSVKKAELRQLSVNEDMQLAQLNAKSQKAANSQNTKVTRSEINARVLEALKRKELEAKNMPPKAGDIVEAMELRENPNYIFKEEMAKALKDSQELVYASGIDDSINVLAGLDASPDPHVERRLKAAYAAYESDWMPRLKAENPSLKRSQLKELLWRQWKKAPENPINK